MFGHLAQHVEWSKLERMNQYSSHTNLNTGVTYLVGGVRAATGVGNGAPSGGFSEELYGHTGSNTSDRLPCLIWCLLLCHTLALSAAEMVRLREAVRMTSRI